MRSIRRQLLFWLLAIVLLGVGIAGWLIYRQALAEANVDQAKGELDGARQSYTIGANDTAALLDAWQLASRIRNAIVLVRGRPEDTLPAKFGELTAVARDARPLAGVVDDPARGEWLRAELGG